MVSYFSLFNISPAFDLELSLLESEYFKAQRLFHPDRFIGKSSEEKIQALQKSANINKAYDVLKNPLKRAQYLLELQGIVVGTDKDSVKPANELLMEVMELRENLPIHDDVLKLTEDSKNKIANHYKNSKFSDMAQEVLRLGYLMKMLEDVKD